MRLDPLCWWCVALFLLCSLAVVEVEAKAAARRLRVEAAPNLIVQIEPWGWDSLRVRIGPQIRNDVVGALLPPPNTNNAVHVSTQGGLRAIANGNLQAVVGADGLLTFTRLSDNKVIVKETARQLNVSGSFYSVQVSYQSEPTERIYGLGEHKTGSFNNKGFKYDFQQCIEYDHSGGGQICIPWFVSSLQYGFLWNLPSFGSVSFTPTATIWTSLSTPQIDIWVTTISGKAPLPFADIMSKYADATGHAPALPQFASGFWQSKDRYRNQTEILGVAQGYVSRGLPISMIVIDWQHWDHNGDWSFNKNCWPDPGGMVQTLAKMGITVMVSVWPTVVQQSVNFAAMNASGYFVQCPTHQNKCHNDDYLYDPTIPAAREFIWNAVMKGYYNYGIKVYWLDADEPEQSTGHPPLIYSIGTQDNVGMTYAWFHQQAFYNGLKAAGEKEVIMLSRSAWAGSQRFGAAVWSGDIASTFDSLTQQIRIALNVALSGIYWWTTDIGGYYGGDITDPTFQELIVRWYQFGAFCPIFRTHGHRNPGFASTACGGGGGYNEIWEFGETAYNAIVPILKIRESLRPYVMEHMNAASVNGTPVLRPLWFDFPMDAGTIAIDDQFMFGPTYMVAPVYTYKARSRSVYFPAGANWSHWFTKTVYKGGTTEANFAAPLDQFPLFTRVNA